MQRTQMLRWRCDGGIGGGIGKAESQGRVERVGIAGGGRAEDIYYLMYLRYRSNPLAGLNKTTSSVCTETEMGSKTAQSLQR